MYAAHSLYTVSKTTPNHLHIQVNFGKVDVNGHTIRQNLIQAIEYKRRAKKYETEYKTLKHAKMAAECCRMEALAAITRCRLILAYRYHPHLP
jgi:hypothetical protein